MGVNDADERVLRATLERAVEVGLFPQKVLGIVESTGVMGVAAVADTFELIRQAVAKVIAAQEACAGRRRGSSRARPASTGLTVRPGGLSWDASSRSPARCWLPPPTMRSWPRLAARWERIVNQDVDPDRGDGGGPGIRRGIAT